MNEYIQKNTFSKDGRRDWINGGSSICITRDTGSDLEPETSIYSLMGAVCVPQADFNKIAKEHFDATFVCGSDPEREFTLPCEFGCEGFDEMVQIYTARLKVKWNSLRKEAARRRLVGLHNKIFNTDEDSSSDSISTDCDIKAVKGNKNIKHSCC